MKNNIVITINREFGSGGRLVGEKLAENLNMAFIDKIMLTEASKMMGITEEHLKSFDEKAPSIWQVSSVNMGSYHGMNIPYYFYSVTNNDLYITQMQLIEKLAKEKNCVFIGRCANIALADYPKKVSIFLYADNAFKKHMIEEIYQFTNLKDIDKEIKRIDKQRSAYYTNYTGYKWRDPHQYDLMINTAQLGIDHTVRLIEHYVRMKYGNI